MYMKIKANGANTIFIHIPGDKAAESLPALAAMFEQNAKFVDLGWSGIKQVTPEISIHLGNSITVEHQDADVMMIEPSDAILDGFLPGTAELFASFGRREAEHKRRINLKEAEITELNAKITRLTAEIERMEESDLDCGEVR